MCTKTKVKNLHFAQTEDIWLKSALEGKRGFIDYNKEALRKRGLRIAPAMYVCPSVILEGDEALT